MLKDFVNRSLGEGMHVVHVVTVAKTNSFCNFSSVAAEKEREWDNPTLQVGIVFGSKDGTYVYRYSLMGWDKYDETSPEDRDLIGDTFKSEGRGYLVAVTPNGNYRVESEANKAIAERIFVDFLRSLGLKNELDEAVDEETEIDLAIDFIKAKIADRTEIQLVLKNKNNKIEYAYTKKLVESLIPAVESMEEVDALGN